MRMLKHHEQRLLRKTNFIEWLGDKTPIEQTITNRYYISDISVFYKYSKLVYSIRLTAKNISKLTDENKKTSFARLLTSNLFNLGVISKPSLLLASKIKIIDFCKRRLPSLMVQLRMVQNMKDSVRFIEQGHVVVGNVVVNDPNLLINNNMEGFIKWRDGSKIKALIDKMEDKYDDYDE
ncbi:U3 small nucleolar ribonucleoprotein IMP3 [Cucumispora dikerogammari]|nr:U3 small nucleolar ribonucleoprotein IMP3 [Cucumispora dikerogammari]